MTVIPNHIVDRLNYYEAEESVDIQPEPIFITPTRIYKPLYTRVCKKIKYRKRLRKE